MRQQASSRDSKPTDARTLLTAEGLELTGSSTPAVARGRGHIILWVIALLLVSGVVLVTEAKPAAAAQCWDTADRPVDDDTEVWGWSRLDCNGLSNRVQYVRTRLQRHRAWGYETIDDDSTTSNTTGAVSVQAERTCNGWGTYTYRTLHNSTDDKGFSYAASSLTYRSAC